MVVHPKLLEVGIFVFPFSSYFYRGHIQLWMFKSGTIQFQTGIIYYLCFPWNNFLFYVLTFEKYFWKNCFVRYPCYHYHVRYHILKFFIAKYCVLVVSNKVLWHFFLEDLIWNVSKCFYVVCKLNILKSENLFWTAKEIIPCVMKAKQIES